jgi:hypothetical protein
MRWQALALPGLIAASLAGCGPKPDRTNESGAVPGTPADTATMSNPATPAPGVSDTTAAPSATPSDTSATTSHDSASDSSKAQ